LRTCRSCGEEFEPTSSSQVYCRLHGDNAPKPEADTLEGGPGHHQSMPNARFPQKAFTDVRLRILQQNVEPNADLFATRLSAVTEARRQRDAQSLRAALCDLAAVCIQAAGHKRVLAVMGAHPPAVPIRSGPR
jgi:hypothetical protein